MGDRIMGNFIKSEPLHLQAYNVLKSSILAGDFADERVVETQLAIKFGVSRGPIREAIRMLLQDGLLTQQGGFIQVFQPTAQNVIEILQCRQGLEAIAVRLATKYFSTKEKNQLLTCVQRTKEADKQKDFKELGILDKEFHDLIIEGSRNEQLVQLMDILRSKVIYIRKNMVPKEYVHFIPDEHERICRAILNGDAEKAEEEMTAHIQQGLEVMLKVIDFVDSE